MARKHLLKDKKISIIAYRELGRDEYNDPIHEWGAIENGENIWAYVRQLSGREIFAAAQVQAEEEMLFVVNWRDNVDTSCQIEYKGLKYDITRIDTYEGYKDDLKIYAKVKGKK